MTWGLLAALVVALGLALLASLARRAELVRLERGLAERDRARERGSDRARLQYPHVDLSRCMGCGLCIPACPEEGVLELVHGQALVVHGARCVGHGRCAQDCPVGAIALTLGDLAERRDLPAVTEQLECIGQPGLFLAGEVTGYALVRTAIEHGRAVASEVAQRCESVAHGGSNGSGESGGSGGSTVLDLVVVGAGPAGISCSLEAKRRELSFVTLDQEGLGGTVAKYPRRKLVLTQPVELPLYGALDRSSYTKEELIELWTDVATRFELPLVMGRTFSGLVQRSDGVYEVHTDGGFYLARNVCLALGRRGSPRKLGVPGEELPKVAYSLIDAQSFQGRELLVVGGGDSAVEAAMGLAEQPGNRVTLSYRKGGFSRIKARNEARLYEMLEAQKLGVLFNSEVTSISPDSVDLGVKNGDGVEVHRVHNDEVFVMAGGIPPFKLLETSGVSFDPALRQDPEPLAEQGSGLAKALAIGLLLALAALAWTLWHADYYTLAPVERRAHAEHSLLRPSRGLGLALGVASALLVAANLCYLARRSPRVALKFGSLRTWMTSHVGTGILALLCALVHSAMAPQNTVGGHALWAMAILVATGAIGRYFYAFVPRAANGRELALDEVRGRLGRLSEEWDRGQREFGERVQAEVQALIEAGRWRGSFVRRLIALAGSQRGLRRALERLEREGRERELPPDQLRETLVLARRAHRASLMAAHYEDLRGLLATWRYVHRWGALLLVLLIAAHVVAALRYAGLFAAGAG